MATLLQVDKVKYLINEDDDEIAPLAKLYFCTYCLALRSADHLQLEIDSHFCPQTLDGLPSGDAAMKKNKSANSWQCPFCSHTLSTRATSNIITAADDPSKQTMKKSYYQACTFCRWSSRGVGMADKDIVNGAWSEVENPNLSRIQNLMEYYKSLSSKEIAELDQKKPSKKRGYFSLAMQMQQKYGGPRTPQSKKITAAVNPLPSSLSALRLKESIKEVTIEPSPTLDLDGIEELPDDIYSKPIDFTQIASVEQRLDQPSYQPTQVQKFRPRRSTMFVKRSLRCKKCDHNIIKPEYNSSSIKFKIQLVAVQHIPEIRIHKVPKLVIGEKNRICLSIINPKENKLKLTLLPNVQTNKKTQDNAELELPSCEFIIARYDETAEYVSTSEGDDEEIGKDDADVVAFRSNNKIGVYINCTPNKDLVDGSDVWISFAFKHQHHVGTIVQQIKGDEKPTIPVPEIVWLQQTVYINLGKAHLKA